ncbi:Amidase [Purpureocillium lavendulum]|uniref:Amidase n=1 Tax=Purpureocillium lavendulum TaxID=1247861 RepID=A0AB34G7D8_9HYPO|nr:Amidase [Purpureocillium lavendulum]
MPDRKPSTSSASSGVSATRRASAPIVNEAAIRALHGTTESLSARQGSYTDPVLGTYEEHSDFATEEGWRHHRETVDAHGAYHVVDIDLRRDGSIHVHKEDENPTTGESSVKDYEHSDNTGRRTSEVSGDGTASG